MNAVVKIGALSALLATSMAVSVWAVGCFVSDLLVTPGPSDSANTAWFLIPAVGGLLLASFAATVLGRAHEWVDALPVKSFLPGAVALSGSAVGAAVSAFSTPPWGWQIASGLAAVAIATIATVRFRLLAGEVRDTRTERTRIERLRTLGTRVRASVDEVEAPGVWVGPLCLFVVTASYESGDAAHTVTEQLLAPIADAPVVDGSVLLWVITDDPDPSNVVMEADPDSIRHPDPAEYLPVPGSQPRRFGGGAA